jgi:type VI secretion system secreted protein Hcp
MAGYIKFDGIDGEVMDKDHKNWCLVSSFSQVLHKTGGGKTGSTRRGGDVQFEDVHVDKEVDKSSPKLAEAVAKGKVFAKVEIDITASYTDAARVTYYRYELKNVQVTSYQVGGSPEQRPHESLSLNFEEIKVTYTEMDNAGKKKGNIEYSWKVEAGEK